MVSLKNSSFWFHGYRLEGEYPCLFDRDGNSVPLRRQSLQVLRLLVEHHDQIVERDFIVKSVWPGVQVTNDSVVQCIGDIRRATRDSDHRIVQVIPRKGYRLNTDVGLMALQLCSSCRKLVLSGKAVG